MDTQFNPFGTQADAVGSTKIELKEVICHVESEILEGTSGKTGLSTEAKNFGAVMEKLTAICKEIDETAIQSLLSELIEPLSQFARLLSTSNDKMKPAEFASFCRSMAKFVQIVADRIVEPFGSDLLEQWAPLFDALLSSTKSSILLKDMGVALWKATFGTVKGALRYPGELRQSLEKLPKKNGVILPPEEKKSTIIFDADEEEAMDGMSGTSSEKEKNSDEKASEVESQSSTFQFSQQPEADEMAEKLLREAKMKEEREKAEKTPVRKEPQSRRRPSRVSLLDEDSSDFIPITTTPPSSRRSRLTDRQKEKLAEATGPRTTTNYVDEESQSGFQKRQQMTEALNKLNYDVGEDSVSVCVASSPKTDVKKAEEPEKTEKFESPPLVQNPPDSPPKSARRSAIRARRLFDNIEKASDEAFEKARKKFESSDGKEEVEGVKDSEDVKEEEKTVEKKVDFLKTEEEESVDSPRRTRGRAKGIPKKSDTTPHPKKRLRSSIIKKEPSSEDIKEVDEEEEDVKSPESKKVKKTEAVPIEEPTHILEKALEVEQIPLATEKSEESSESPVKKTSEEMERSPPKTPRTPSILRVGKRAAVDGSPMTERKKNRVHFNEDSLPQDAAPSSPQTPRRNQVVLAVDVKSPQKTTTSSTTTTTSESTENTTSSENTTGLLEISDPTSSTSPFFKNLVGCQDPIEKVVRKLAPMCLKTAVDTVKKSLHKAGVKTVGEFAALSRRQLNEIAGLKHPKEKCARSVLAEYEAMKREEQRASEERILEGTEGVEVKRRTAQKLFDDVAPKTSEDKVETLQPIARIVDFSSTESDDVQMEEVNSEEPEKPSESPQASESPTSPVKAASSESANSRQNSEDVRKNLAPIFDKTRVKKEPPSPEKQLMRQANGSAMVDDARLLHKISCSLSRAHSLNQLPSDEWTNLLDIINKSAILFKNIVQERGTLLDEWEDDVENHEQSQESTPTSPEEDVKSLRGVYRRFSRHHSIGDVTDATWQKVMESVNEAALLLRSIVVERAPRN